MSGRLPPSARLLGEKSTFCWRKAALRRLQFSFDNGLLPISAPLRLPLPLLSLNFFCFAVSTLLSITTPAAAAAAAAAAAVCIRSSCLTSAQYT